MKKEEEEEARTQKIDLECHGLLRAPHRQPIHTHTHKRRVVVCVCAEWSVERRVQFCSGRDLIPPRKERDARPLFLMKLMKQLQVAAPPIPTQSKKS